MRDVRPIIAEIQRLAEARRQSLALGTADDAKPPPLAAVDLREPVRIPESHPLGRLLALADRLRRRVLQAVLIRQSEFNRQASFAIAVLSDRLEAAERDRDTLEQAVEGFAARIAELDERLSRLQSLAEARRAYEQATPASATSAPPLAMSHPDPAYVHLEAHMRGDEATIRERQRSYVDLFASDGGPILDLGCGRGEFLELLRAAGRVGRGVDRAPENVRRCREKGLDVVESDALEYLAGLADQSLGGVFSAQFIEHVTPEYFLALVRACFAKLRPGARVVLETINADSLATLPTFYADPTHAWPIPPGTAQLVLEGCGFAPVEIRYTSAFPPEARLQPSDGDSLLAQRFDDAVAKLNQVLFGAREYAVIATR